MYIAHLYVELEIGLNFRDTIMFIFKCYQTGIEKVLKLSGPYVKCSPLELKSDRLMSIGFSGRVNPEHWSSGDMGYGINTLR